MGISQCPLRRASLGRLKSLTRTVLPVPPFLIPSSSILSISLSSVVFFILLLYQLSLPTLSIFFHLSSSTHHYIFFLLCSVIFSSALFFHILSILFCLSSSTNRYPFPLSCSAVALCLISLPCHPLSSTASTLLPLYPSISLLYLHQLPFHLSFSFVSFCLISFTS